MKNKNLLKRVSFFVIAVMAFMIVGMHVGVEEAYAADFTYSDNGDGTVTLYKYNGNSSSVTIPDTSDGKKVTVIREGAFMNKTSLTSVTLPNHSVTIGRNAFSGCTSLKTVNNSKNATVINPGAFVKCSSLTSFTFSESLEVLGDSTFSNSGLTSVYLPASVRSLQKQVFMNCKSLKKVTIANSNIEFFDNTVFNGTSATICAPSGSTAQAYAGSNGLKFEVYSGGSGSSSGGSSSGNSSGGSSGGSGNGSASCSHRFTFAQVVEAATCFAEGKNLQKCDLCGVTQLVTTPKTNHYYGDYVVDKSATTSSTGSKSRVCVMCNNKQVVEIPKLNQDGSSNDNVADNTGSGNGSGNSSSSGSSGNGTGNGSSGNGAGNNSSGNSSSGGSSGGSTAGDGAGSNNSGNSSGGNVSDNSGNGSGNGSDSGNSNDVGANGGGSSLSGVENMVDTSVEITPKTNKIPPIVIVIAVVLVIGVGAVIMKVSNR